MILYFQAIVDNASRREQEANAALRRAQREEAEEAKRRGNGQFETLIYDRFLFANCISPFV